MVSVSPGPPKETYILDQHEQRNRVNHVRLFAGLLKARLRS